MFTKADIEKYFMAEKQAGLLFLVIGVIAVLLAIVFFFFLKTNAWKGAAVPLLVFGLLGAIVGYVIYARSDGDRIRNVYAYDMNPQELKDKEWPRMQKVSQNFAIYRWIEIVLVIAGIALILVYRTNADKAFWYGVGVTLAILGLLFFVADTYAEKRAKEYTGKLKAFFSVRPL